MNTKYRINVRSVIATAVLTSAIALSAQAETLEDYVATCKDELDFTSIPQMDCRKENFRVEGDNRPLPVAMINGKQAESVPSFSASNDFVAHKRINNSVDAVFACRWVDRNEGNSGAASGEMIVHNRRSGKTCFFELKKDKTREDIRGAGLVATTNPASPTSSTAAEFWAQPSEVQEVCTQCHVAGPYIASSAIVGALAKFGLINDGHDTFAERYSAVGATFGDLFNQTIRNEIQTAAINYKPSIGSSSTVSTGVTAGCASACHVIGGKSRLNVQVSRGAEILLPPIGMIIYDDIIQGGHMPPIDPYSDYRWLNRDDPGSTADNERLSEFIKDKNAKKNDYSKFYCDNAMTVQAHRVDSSTIFTPSSLDRFRKFNVQDGLICNNADYDRNNPYKCFDYETRYKCDGEWTAWKNHTKDSTGDDESRSRYQRSWGLCDNPSDIQARYKAPVSGAPYVDPFYGPRDRFRTFDNEGLLCMNEDQDDGSCSNYVVRFICP